MEEIKMHSFTAATELPTSADYTFFNFNSDLSGDVTIQRGDSTIEVPGDHLMQFIANYIRRQKIEALEQADDRQILGL
jgi:hypothetical protein